MGVLDFLNKTVNGTSGNTKQKNLTPAQEAALGNMVKGYGGVTDAAMGALTGYATDANLSNTFYRNGGDAAFDRMEGNIRINENNANKNLAAGPMNRFTTAYAGQKALNSENAAKSLNELQMNKFETMAAKDKDSMAQQFEAMRLAQQGLGTGLGVQAFTNQQTYKPSAFENLVKGVTGVRSMVG